MTKLLGKDILRSETLQEKLLTNNYKVLKIIWDNRKVSTGLGKNIKIQKINNVISLVEGNWIKPITDGMIINIF